MMMERHGDKMLGAAPARGRQFRPPAQAGRGSVTAPRERLIVALDVPTAEEAEALVARLGDSVSFYKIGMELIYGGGGLGLAER